MPGPLAGSAEVERDPAPDALKAPEGRVLAAARLAPGEDVLVLDADGAGALAFPARRRIGGGCVYAVHPDPGALEELLRAAHEDGAAGIGYLIGDACVLPLPDGSVDVALGRSALRDVADLAEVAGELHRVLRPGGRVSLCEPVDRQGTDLAIADLATADNRSPLGEELAAALRGAGFVDVEVELERLVAQLEGRAETTIGFRRTVAWVTARKP